MVPNSRQLACAKFPKGLDCEGGLFLVAISGVPTVRHVQNFFNGKYKVKPFNDLYNSYDIGQGSDVEHVHILHRVTHTMALQRAF